MKRVIVQHERAVQGGPVDFKHANSAAIAATQIHHWHHHCVGWGCAAPAARFGSGLLSGFFFMGRMNLEFENRDALGQRDVGIFEIGNHQ